MDMRGARANAMKFMGVATVAALVCGLLLLTVIEGGGKPGFPGKAGSTLARTSAPLPGAAKENSRWREAYGKLPLSFEENIGQTAREVRYVAHGGRYEVFLTPQEAVVALRPSGHLDFSPRHRFATLRALREARRNARQADRMTVLRMQMAGANPQPKITGMDVLPGKVNYFIGNDPRKWHTDVRTYAKVKYDGVYPGVDLIFYSNQRRLEYDFIIAPGANPEVITLNVNGAGRMHINSHGDVVVSVPGGEVELQKPVIYQQVKGERHVVGGSYILAGNHRVTFSVPSYDRNEPLVLDPVLNYSTYVGGTSDDSASGIALDSKGDAFIAGTTTSTNFPVTANAFQSTAAAVPLTNTAAFVSELNPAGNTLLYSSYIAGSTPGETAFGVAVDPTGKAVYVTGQTFSPDFPTSNAANAGFIPGFKTGNNAGATTGASFLAKFDPTQTTGANSFVYSTFIGGTNGTGTLGDLGLSVAAGANGVAYVTGLTDSSPGNATNLATFPVVGGFQTTLGTANGGGNAFLAKIDTTVSGSGSLISSSYLGGDAVLFPGANSPGFGDAGFGVAVDSSGNAYVVGTTTSSDLGRLTGTGLSLNYPAGNTSNTAFFAKINTATAGTQTLSYLTYLGGTGHDFGHAIAVGPSNVAYLTGDTGSLDFPVSNGAFQTTGSVGGVAFVSLIDTAQPAASSLTHSTFLGGGGGDDGRGIQADSQGNAYLAGATSSSIISTGKNFPVSPGALQTTLTAGAFANGFVSKLDPTLSTLLYSSYFGGSGDGNSQDLDTADGIALDSANPPNVYIAGQTFSTNLPVAGTPVPPLHAGLNGTGSDAFVAKLSLIPTLAVTPTSLNFGVQPVNVTSSPQTVTLTNNTSDPIPFTNSDIAFNGTNAADFASPSNTCGTSLAAGASCTVDVTFKPSVTSAESATLAITVTITVGGQSSSQTFDVGLSGSGSASSPGVGLAPTSLAFGNQQVNTTSAAKTVTLTNTGTTALTISSIAASGDFAETSTGATACPISPATLAAAGNCTISVTFTPTAAGARNGTLTITDNAGGSPHTVSLTGNGTNPPPDFTLSAAPTTLTVAQGAVGTPVTITVNPTNGFNSAVALTCTGAPAKSSCALSPASITPPTTSALTFTAHAMLVPLPISKPTPPLNMLRIVPLFIALMLLLLLRSTQRFRTRLAMVSLIFVCATLAACNGPGYQQNNNNTAKGMYTLTVTGTSGALTHNIPVTVTVN